ncbi:PEPxxWA-CTERM sorting domain-containing protein [Sphingomonas nostoxanthinifaciens]|uniref:PEPxxWA-CTERM sorting domain-containing protein n=1 Tax=Sphingomonas nostoxanthinifaciens TaxID=2872652 RepID=UPI001CC217E1|nr:PEPxxWA-CTERM sorting domain-containing protein [Sphingomonas nostoxanthinifaciens]UAK26405.1 PEPxxWA-CTERM sorting domain-containing protein [Sphingomonas nostoxanthinifaciens]
MLLRYRLCVSATFVLLGVAAATAPATAAPVLVGVATDFASSPFSFTVDGSTFTFSGTGDIFGPTAIQTSGGAAVNSFGGFLGIPVEPTSYFVDRGTVSFGPGDPFASFGSGAAVPYSNGNNFIGLRATQNGADYYGYAFTTDSVLNAYAFETAPGTAITASTAVPEPISWSLMVGGFGLVGAAMRRRRVAGVRFA